MTRSRTYPYLIPEAEIISENSLGTRFSFKAKTPKEASDALLHCANNDGKCIFNRSLEGGMISPICIRMNKRIRLKSDNKERVVNAFNIQYQALEDEGILWLSNSETCSYYWIGDDKIEEKPPLTFRTTNMHSLITVLNRAGNKWQDVNIMLPNHRPHLRLVSNRA